MPPEQGLERRVVTAAESGEEIGIGRGGVEHAATVARKREAGTIARRELERYVKGDITELPSPEVIAEEVVKARRKSLLNKSSEKRVKFSAKKTDRETLEERAKQAADKDVARESLKRLGLRKS
jgi:hypothetical protein